MISATIFPGRYIQGGGAIEELGGELSHFGARCFILCDSLVLDTLFGEFRSALERQVGIAVERFGGECSDPEIDRLSDLAGQAACHSIAGIGGGKTLDTAKAVAQRLSLPVAVVPTIASTDAPCSSLSIIYTPEGEFLRAVAHGRNPNLVLVDTGIVARAPVRLLVSGMGDALATWFEAESCQRRHAANIAGRVGSLTAHALARLCYDTILEYGVLARSACEARVVTPALERVVEANTLLSGLGFESGGLAAAHAIHNGLTALAPVHRFYHGEKVAVGTLASLFLTGKPARLIDEVYGFCESVGLPTTLGAIGLEGVTNDDLRRVAEKACAPGESIHNEPLPVTPSDVLAGLRAMDAEGKRRTGAQAGAARAR
ncbi:MAG: glycerol dehydrogenase [Bryobacterales bacterium]|nr:glycerol dehydrogenase [Bryobacterales bacterium]